jgi:hypothetical protein
MAYVNSMRPTYHAGASAATQTPNLSSHATNDLLVIAMQWANGGTVSLTTGSGWVKALEATSPGTLSIWYKVAGASETAPTFTCTNSGDRCAVCLTIKDAPTTSPIDITASTSETKNLGATTYKGTLSSVTTTTDDALCLLFTSANNAFYTAQVANTIPHLMTGVSAESMTVSSLTYPSSGAQDALTFYVSRAAAITHLFVQIIVKNDAGGGVRGQLDTSALPSTLVTTWSDGGTNTDISNAGTALVADLDGDTTAHEALQTSSSKSILPYAANSVVYWAGYHVLNEASSAETSAAVDAVETLDLSNSLIAATINGSGFEGWKPYATGGQYIGLANTSLAGATYFKVAASDTKAKTATGSIPVVFNTGSADGRFVDGTDDLTDVNDVFLGGNKDSTSSFVCGPIHKLNTLILIGGNTAKPTNCADLVLFALNMGLNTVLAQNNLSDGQYFILQSFQIGNGSKPTNWQSRNQSIEFPGAYSEADLNIAARIPKSGLAFTLYASSSDTIDLTNTTINFGDYHTATIHASGSTSAAYNFSGCTWINPGAPTLKTGISYTGLTITGGEEIQHDASTTIDQSSTPVLNGVTVDNVATGETAAVIVSTETQFANVVTGATFTNNTNAPAIRITGDQTYTGVGWDDPGLTVSGNTVDIEYTGDTDFSIQSGASLTVNNTGLGTLTVVTPVVSLTVSSNIAASDIKIFNTGTQTIEAQATGTTASTTTTGTYDITVQKAGYLPQRQTGVVLGTSSVPVNITLVKDPVYNASHGLTYTTDFSYNRSTSRLTCVTRQAGRDFYSAMIDAFIAQSSLDNTPFPLTAVGIDSIFFNDDAELLDATSEDNWFDAGIRYINSSGTTTAEWCSIKSSGSIPAGVTGRYQTGPGTGTTALRTTGAVNQIIQIYGDATHGNFDYRSYLVIKFQANPYVDTRSDILSLAGVSTLEPFEYSVAIEPTALDITAGDSGAALTLVDHTAAPITVGGKSFSYEIQDGGTNSAEAILRAWDYNIAQTGTYQSTDTFNLPEFVAQSGSSYETRRGIVETKGYTLYGCYVSRGGSDHPDFTRFASDDGTYYTPATFANAIVTNMPTDGTRRLQIKNITTGQIFYSGQPSTANYQEPYLNGDTQGRLDINAAGDNLNINAAGDDLIVGAPTITAGDSVRIRFAEVNGPTSFKYFQTIVTASSTGFSVDASLFIETDPVYASNATDGSGATVTSKFAPDYVDAEVDLIVAQNFTAAEAYAFFCYTLTLTDGIDQFWGGVEAKDIGNYEIQASVLDLKFDNLTTTNLRQTDTARIYRDDGAYPVKNDGATTGGGGVDVNWKNQVFVQTITLSGSNVITGDIADVAAQVQAGMTSQGYTAPRAAALDTIDSINTTVTGLADDVWSSPRAIPKLLSVE